MEHLCRAATSAFGGHLLEEGHSFDSSTDSKILHNITTRNYNRLYFIEDLEITKEMAFNRHSLNKEYLFTKKGQPA